MMMQKKLLSIVGSLLLILFSGCASTPLQFKSGSEPDGFKGIRWGRNIASLEAMVRLKDRLHPENRIFINKNDLFIMEEVRLDEIYYFFWKGKFYAVDIYTKGYQNFRLLRKLALSRFGEPQPSPHKKQYRYSWIGEITQTRLSYHKRNQQGILRIEAKTISEEAAEQTKNYLEASKDKKDKLSSAQQF